MPNPLSKVELTDDSKEQVPHLIRNRLPWLFVGLFGSLLTVFVVSRFEAVLLENIALAFFMPTVVYISAAVGAQTQTVFVRTLAHGRDRFGRFIAKEILLGIGLGLILGSIVGAGAYLWFTDTQLALSVGLSILINLSLAPLVALVISETLYKVLHTDPALGSGPVATITQDIISITVYFLTTSLILLH